MFLASNELAYFVQTDQDERVSGHADDDDAEVEGEQGVEGGGAQSSFTLDSGFQVVDKVLDRRDKTFRRRRWTFSSVSWRVCHFRPLFADYNVCD